MKRIKWTNIVKAMTKDKRIVDRVTGTKNTQDSVTDVVMTRDSGVWSIQVMSMRTVTANTLKSAKRRAGKISDEMEGKVGS